MQETQETRVQSLGWEDPLEEEGMTTHSSIVAWRIPWTEEPGGLQSMGMQELNMAEATEHMHNKSKSQITFQLCLSLWWSYICR